MSRPPADWLSAVHDLLAARAELAGVGVTAAHEVVTA